MHEHLEPAPTPNLGLVAGVVHLIAKHHWPAWSYNYSIWDRWARDHKHYAKCDKCEEDQQNGI
jgi:hypothetical protein